MSDSPLRGVPHPGGFLSRAAAIPSHSRAFSQFSNPVEGEIIGKNSAKWKPEFKGVEAELKALLATPEMQKVQTKAIVVKNKPAIQAANTWAQEVNGPGTVPTVREYTLFLDTFVQSGGTKKNGPVT